MKAKILLFQLLSVGFSVFVFAALTCGADTASLKIALESEIRAAGIEISLAFKDLETGEKVLIRETDMVHAASTMKVAVMVEVFNQHSGKRPAHARRVDGFRLFGYNR